MSSSRHVLTSPKFVFGCAAITFAIAFTNVLSHWDLYFGKEHSSKEISFPAATMEVTWGPKTHEPRVNIVVGGERAFHSTCRGLTESVCHRRHIGSLLVASDIRAISVERNTGILTSGTLTLSSGESLHFVNAEVASFVSGYREEVTAPISRTLFAAILISAFGVLLQLRSIRSRRTTPRADHP